MFYLHQSNRTEFLLELLAKLMELQPLADPFAQEIVVVQSQGMARWLSLQLAARQGIAANISCPFPAAFLWRLAELHAGHADTASPWDEEAFVWAIFHELLQDTSGNSYPELAAVLRQEDRQLGALALARRLTALFDRYTLFRSDLLTAWDRGTEDDWPARLWRALVARHGAGHRAALFADLARGADEALARRAKLPERIAIFGVPSLPPLHLEIFSRLGQCIDLHFFLLNPCQTFWQDLLSPARMEIRGAQTPSSLDLGRDLHFETGNGLLLGLGRLAGEFQHQLQQLDPVVGGELFDDPGADSLLHAVQQDILLARHRPAQGPPLAIVDDESIQLQICHSPQREVEVLRDRLLDIFARHPDIEPRDVLVMVPDIGRYAPYVEALFSARRHPAIPVTVADRALAEKSLFFRSALRLLRLLGSRMTVSEVLPLLEAQPVRDCFGIDIDALQTITLWVQEAGICWGLDQEHRRALGLAGDDKHTWMEGIDRLFLGLAMEDDSWRLFDGLLPVPVDGTSQGGVFAAFAAFITLLHRYSREASQPRSMQRWTVWLKGLFAAFLAETDDSVQDMILLHAQLQNLEDAATAGAADDSLELAVVAAALENALSVPARQGGFLAGGVTFCRMVPMRAIPFRVVCLLGMDDASFPRREKPLAIDLMARARRPGDRDRRDDDRYLFLETILSARDILYISYPGRDPRDDSERPAASMVDDLLDYISDSCALPAQELRRRLVTRHPLHPFSREYFDGRQDRLFSYDVHWEKVACRIELQEDAVPLVVAPDDTGLNFGIEQKTLDMDELIRFLMHPVRYFLRKRLGLDLNDEVPQNQDRELFVLDGLKRYRLKELLADILVTAGEPAEELAAALAGAGLVPVLPAGAAVFRDELDRATNFSRQLQEARGPLLPMVSGSLAVDEWTLSWTLATVTDRGQFFARRIKKEQMKMADYVRFWLGHLFFQAQTFLAVPERSGFFVCEDAVVPLPPVAADVAGQRLARLVRLYEEGMTRALPLFPVSSLVLANELQRERPDAVPGKAWAKAARAWEEGDYQSAAEKIKDPYLRACFDGPNPFCRNDRLSEEILGLARVVLEPFFFSTAEHGGAKR